MKKEESKGDLIYMSAIDSLIKALSEQQTIEDYKGDCDDYDFGEVLKEFSNNDNQAKHLLRYADGTEEYFKFEDEDI